MYQELEFYKDHSSFTLLDSFADRFNNIENDIASVCQCVQDHLVHAYWLQHYGIEVDEASKMEEMQLRTMKQIMTAFSREQRSPPQIISICRDFALMTCAILRQKGLPARVRCGFAKYLTTDRFEDHWVCEYWDVSDNRWVMVDSQLDSVHQQILGFRFSPYDVPHSEFIYAGTAWHLCQNQDEDPEKFGIFDFKGPLFIKGNMTRDVFALAKTELLGWDSGWGIIKKYLSPIESNEERELLQLLANCSHTSNMMQALDLTSSHADIKLPEDWRWSQAPTLAELYRSFR